MTKGCPCWTIFRVDGDEFDVIFNCSLVFSISSTILSKLVNSINIDQVISFSSCKCWFNLALSSCNIVGSSTSHISLHIWLSYTFLLMSLRCFKIVALSFCWILLELLWLELLCLSLNWICNTSTLLCLILLLLGAEFIQFLEQKRCLKLLVSTWLLLLCELVLLSILLACKCWLLTCESRSVSFW